MDLNSRWRSAAFYRTAVCGLAKTTVSRKSLAGKPGGVFRGQKDSDGGNITWLADAAERGLREGELFELRSDEAAAVGAFSLDYAGTEGVDPDLFRAELTGQHDGDGVDRGLSAGVNRAVRRCDVTGNGAHVYDAASLSEVLHSGLRNKEEAQHIDVEVPVKVLLGDSLEGGVLVHAGVVYEDVESAVVFDGGFDDTLCLGRLGDVARHGDGFATSRRDGGDNCVCTILAGSIVHHYECTFCSQQLGDGRSDAFGSTCDDCDFTCEVAHFAVIPFVDMSTTRVTRCQISVRPGKHAVEGLTQSAALEGARLESASIQSPRARLIPACLIALPARQRRKLFLLPECLSIAWGLLRNWRKPLFSWPHPKPHSLPEQHLSSTGGNSPADG